MWQLFDLDYELFRRPEGTVGQQRAAAKVPSCEVDHGNAKLVNRQEMARSDFC